MSYYSPSNGKISLVDLITLWNQTVPGYVSVSGGYKISHMRGLSYYEGVDLRIIPSSVTAKIGLRGDGGSTRGFGFFDSSPNGT